MMVRGLGLGPGIPAQSANGESAGESPGFNLKSVPALSAIAPFHWLAVSQATNMAGPCRETEMTCFWGMCFYDGVNGQVILNFALKPVKDAIT